MLIQKYDLYAIKNSNYVNINIDPILNSTNNIYYIRTFLLYCFGYLKRKNNFKFEENIKAICEHGMTFDNVDISVDNKNNIVYFIESFYDYDTRKKTLKIKELLEAEDFIELCKIGFLNHITMTKDNFIYLLTRWNKILDELPPFVLLYQDDKDWFDIISFELQELMEEFVADHTK